jgi:catechol 2,3-dioxygenase-like lactoylglutathione lyase family enzyme
MGQRSHRVNHIGMSVRNLDRSLAFYQSMFGVEPINVGVDSGPGLSGQTGLEDARIRFATVSTGSIEIELIEYEHPRGKNFERAHCDVGTAHICFEVADIEASYTELLAKGLPLGGPPVRLGEHEGQYAGYGYVYLKDPDGIPLELIGR